MKTQRRRCPEGGIALVEHLRKLQLNASPREAPKRFVCSREIADSIGKELLELQLYPDGRIVPYPEGQGARRRARGSPWLRTGDVINGMRVEVFTQDGGNINAGVAWVS